MEANYQNSLIGVIIYFLIELIIKSWHFNEMQYEFYEEYLNLAEVQELKKENGLYKLINLSKKYE